MNGLATILIFSPIAIGLCFYIHHLSETRKLKIGTTVTLTLDRKRRGKIVEIKTAVGEKFYIVRCRKKGGYFTTQAKQSALTVVK